MTLLGHACQSSAHTIMICPLRPNNISLLCLTCAHMPVQSLQCPHDPKTLCFYALWHTRNNVENVEMHSFVKLKQIIRHYVASPSSSFGFVFSLLFVAVNWKWIRCTHAIYERVVSSWRVEHSLLTHARHDAVKWNNSFSRTSDFLWSRGDAGSQSLKGINRLNNIIASIPKICADIERERKKNVNTARRGQSQILESQKTSSSPKSNENSCIRIIFSLLAKEEYVCGYGKMPLQIALFRCLVCTHTAFESVWYKHYTFFASVFFADTFFPLFRLLGQPAGADSNSTYDDHQRSLVEA